ncbi:hypothetical protein BTO05_00885 [Winogradskyella sp. PC-19]|uniref:hypothetical protein n=1 Tax=Winogradskyella sp. PC-19 TaxID=754417 RepID=UPI000B3C13B1|nr:hypothetical protein [Winogradskyella sp. PC-19]ARV08261.1 hypothetical protein BTO05_00885 [Winogradskyella sp. PC-19]
MKKLFTIIIIASFAHTMQAQDIINTLGSNGSFLVNKNDGTNFLKVDPFGKVGIGTDTPTSTLEVSGSISLSNFVTIANSYTMGDSDYTLIGVQTGTLTVNLPEVTSAINGRIYVIKRRDDTVDISPFTGQSIDGLTTFTLDAANEFVVIQAIYQDAPFPVATWVAIGGKY